uniref:C2H2-type domain-containing protein n=1 Tax=Anas zonorhyncha TaxID=75864 RepID=A0A8B9VK74_9AVES
MPRAFLVKKPCVATAKRNWSELPDEQRAEIYVPRMGMEMEMGMGWDGAGMGLGLDGIEMGWDWDGDGDRDRDGDGMGTGMRMEKRRKCGKGLGWGWRWDLRSPHIHPIIPPPPNPPGVRPYKCSLCEKAFTQRCSLESHLKKIHGVAQRYAYKERRAKLYVCEECGGTADSQDAHLAHLRQRHPHSPLLAKLARK